VPVVPVFVALGVVGVVSVAAGGSVVAAGGGVVVCAAGGGVAAGVEAVCWGVESPVSAA
jgi:hypothetical protein